MGVISKPSTFSANTTIDSSDVNDDFDTIYNAFNGSIDAANLASNAVTTAKIADANVTTAKIANNAITLALLDANLGHGWIDAGETWTYSSYDSSNKTGVVTITGDVTSKYSAGMKLRFVNNSVTCYAILTAVSYSNPTSTMKFYMGTDYSLNNSAITANYYSFNKIPFGFPADPAKWTVTATSTTERSTSSSSFASLTDTISVPIGSWLVKHQVFLRYEHSSTSAQSAVVALSSDASTETNPALSHAVYMTSPSAATIRSGYKADSSDHITVSSATTFTVIGKCTSGTIYTENNVTTAYIKAICAFL